jgi:hypothetical protein
MTRVTLIFLHMSPLANPLVAEHLLMNLRGCGLISRRF